MTISRAEAEAAFSDFDATWTIRRLRDQTRLLTLVVECVEYDGEAGTEMVTSLPNGFSSLVTAQLMETA